MFKKGDIVRRKPAGFEVGKQYYFKSLKGTGGYIPVATIEFISTQTGKAYGYWNTEKSPAFLPLDKFDQYEEYTPPSPEDWRILYRTEPCGTVVMGAVPHTSEAAARRGPWWSKEAFKVVRVDV